MPTRRGAGRTPGLLDLASDQATFSFLEEFDGLLISVAPMRQEASYVDFSTRMNNLVQALKICPGHRALLITYIGVVGVFGDQGGQEVGE